MRGGNLVRVYNDGALIKDIPVGRNPRDVAVNPVTGNMYVPNYDSNSVVVLNASNNIAATFYLDSGPIDAAVDSANDLIYVANWLSDTVSVLNGTGWLGTVAVGKNPRRVAVDENSG
jgi:YVTN family beta-propeller protein